MSESNLKRSKISCDVDCAIYSANSAPAEAANTSPKSEAASANLCRGDHVTSSTASEQSALSHRLSEFQLERVLSHDIRCHSIAVLARAKSQFPLADSAEQREAGDNVAVVLLKKSAFDEQRVERYFSNVCELSEVLKNDIYTTYTAQLVDPCLNCLDVSIIYPATQKHIAKYSTKQPCLIEETPELYESVLVPYLAQHQFSLTWVSNILDGVSESERVVLRDEDPDTGFVLVGDMKWDGECLDTLHLIVLARRSDLHSLRHLHSSHLPLLINIHQKALDGVANRYGIARSQLIAFIHYLPSFYHLHVHIVTLKSYSQNLGYGFSRNHLLSTVIDNIRLCGDYYQRATIPYCVVDQTLKQKFIDAGVQLS